MTADKHRHDIAMPWSLDELMTRPDVLVTGYEGIPVEIFAEAVKKAILEQAEKSQVRDARVRVQTAGEYRPARLLWVGWMPYSDEELAAELDRLTRKLKR